MSSTLVKAAPQTGQRPTTVRRFGYTTAIAANGVLLWLAHQLLAWEWPGFLTGAFADVLPLVSLSLVASMAVNALFLVRDRGRLRAAGDLVTAAFGLAVSLRVWEVFPFDFSGYGNDWSWAIRAALVVGIVGSVIGLLVNAWRLGSRTPARSPG